MQLFWDLFPDFIAADPSGAGFGRDPVGPDRLEGLALAADREQLNGKVYAVGGIGAAHRGAYDPLSAGHGGKPDGGDADDCRVLYPSATVRRGDRELRN